MTAKSGQDPVTAAVDRLREMVAECATPMTVSAPDGQFVLTNEAFAVLVDRPARELLQLRFQDITHPEDNARAALATARAVAGGGRIATIDKRYLRGDGTAVPVRISSTIIRTERGDPALYLTVVTDLSELRAAQAQAHGERDRARRVIASSTDAYIGISSAGVIEEWNPAAVRLFGWSRTEAVGSLLADLVVPDELRAAHRAGLDHLNRTGEARIVGRTLSLPGLRRDGARVSLEVAIWAAEEPGAPAGYHAFLRDVTDATTAAEETRRQALVFAAISDAVFLTGPDGRILEVNPAGEALFGRPREALLGTTAGSLLDPDTAIDVGEVRTAADVRGQWAGDVTFTRPDGQRRVSAATVRPLHNPDGTPHGFLAVHRDVTDARRVTAELIAAEARWRLSFDLAPIGMGMLALDGTWVRVNAALCAIVGYTQADLMARTFQGITHPEDLGNDLALLAQLRSGEIAHYRLEKRYLHADGHIVWVALTASLLRDSAGEPIHFMAQIQDVTQAKEAAAQLAASEARYRLLAENSSDIITQTAADGTVLYVSPSYERIFGRPAAQFIGGPLVSNVHPDDQEGLHQALATVLAGTPARLQARRQTADGAWIWLESSSEPLHDPASGAVVGVQSASRDITARKAAEAELERLALYDVLTGLANRALLADHLRQAQRRLTRQRSYLGLLMIDLDDFKTINDTHGHGIGDAVLVEVAHRLLASARPTDTVARLGGDEFIVLLDGLSEPEQAALVAARILGALRDPIVVDNLSIDARASIGLVTTSDATHPAQALHREADTALYQAKNGGRDRYATYRR